MSSVSTPTYRRPRIESRRSPRRRPKATTSSRTIRSRERGERVSETLPVGFSGSVAQPAQELSAPAKQRSDVLWYNREVDLDQQYPIAMRFSVRKSYGWIILGVIACISFIMIHGLAGFGHMDDPFTRAHVTVFRISLLGLIVSISYWELYRRSFSYQIEGFRLLIQRGIFFKVYASVPLLPVADILVRRGFSDMIFGLYNVSLLIPVSAGDHMCTISGLTKEASFGLREYLCQQLNNQVFVADAALKTAEHPTS